MLHVRKDPTHPVMASNKHTYILISYLPRLCFSLFSAAAKHFPLSH